MTEQTQTADDGTVSQRQDVTPEELARLPEFYAPAVSPDGEELAFFHDTSGRIELYTLDISDGEWTQWSDSNVPRNLSAGLAWAADGERIYEARENPGPAIVKVHGGPTAHSKQWFDRYAQFLVSQGYTVLCPNYRGSTGRGQEFKYKIRNDWGGMEQVDIRCGAEFLAERPSVDPEDNEAFYRERSPIEHVENVDAPLYIIHGVNDPRCPISQARTFRDALEEQGLTEGKDGEFEITELGEEGHGSTDVKQKVRAFELLADFLDRRVS